MASTKSKKTGSDIRDDSYRVSDILKRVPNRFLLSIAVAKRARQLKEGATPLIDLNYNPETPVITAILEFFAQKIDINVSERKENHSDILDEISDYLDSDMLDDLNSVIPVSTNANAPVNDGPKKNEDQSVELNSETDTDPAKSIAS